MKKIVFSILIWALHSFLYSQSLPSEVHFSADGRTLISGKQPASGYYDSTIIRELRLNFDQSNYWQQLTANYATRTPIPATLTIDGFTLDSVGVGFKGNTSYMNVQNSQKKSFNIKTEEYILGQDVYGYSTLNLNNAFEDRSFLREVFYLHQIRKHIPAAKANFVHLFINDEDWGIYPNVQQINKDYLEQWFFSNDGANFRAHVRTSGGPGGPGGGGAQWGDGTAALNYLGADTALYQTKYTLKSSDIDSSWQFLIRGCYELNSVPDDQLTVGLPPYLDIDRILWYLASEIAFSDDDSYVFKGKMDYYVYYDPETGRLTPLEFDGNSVMAANATNWSPFYNANNVNYPLLNRLLNNPEYRQRYLAHLRVLIQDELNPAQCNAILDNYKAQIDALVNADPKKLYTYPQFLAEVDALKSWITNRNSYLNSNAELAQAGPEINFVKYINSDGAEWQQPAENTTVDIQAQINPAAALFGVNLYYSNALTGVFDQIAMFDDGLHNDGASGDGLYGASIEGNSAGTFVRFYVEAIANNTQKSVSYLPRGAEHDVFVYQVKSNQSSINGLVINEIVASNSTGASDQMGEKDDWIELYNNSSIPVDLSGFFFSDNILNLNKWEIPSGTSIPGNGYLIFWADEDSAQGLNHCNFKLSSLGESVMLFDTELNLVDSLNFGAEQVDVAFARVPNGTGSFVHQGPTFNANNDTGASGIESDSHEENLLVFPIPARERLHIRTHTLAGESYAVVGMLGNVISTGYLQNDTEINTSALASGVYFLKVGSLVQRFSVQH